MSTTTYPVAPGGERLQDEVIDAEILAEEVFEIHAQRLLARVDPSSGILV
jgi:hypothetical protein